MEFERKIRALLLSPIYDDPTELPPMGFLYLAGYLRGHPRIELHVPHCSLTPKHFRELIAEREYDAICTGGMLTFVDTFAKFLDAAREAQPKALRVLGGPIVSAFPGERLFSELDFHVGVVGEGEATLEDVLLAHADGRPLSRVPGLLCRGLDGRAFLTEARAPINLKTCNVLPDWSICYIEAAGFHCGAEFSEAVGHPEWNDQSFCPNCRHHAPRPAQAWAV